MLPGLGLAALAGLAIGAAWLLRAAPAQSEHQTKLAVFTQNGVNVEITLLDRGAAGAWLIGVFTPTQQHFHLYSADLPPKGVNGLGRPTRLEIVSGNALRPAGPLAVDQAATSEYLDVLKLSLSVYPEGAVTLRLPVTRSAGATGSVELSVTYEACSDGACLPPVVDKRVSVPAAALGGQ